MVARAINFLKESVMVERWELWAAIAISSAAIIMWAVAADVRRNLSERDYYYD